MTHYFKTGRTLEFIYDVPVCNCKQSEEAAMEQLQCLLAKYPYVNMPAESVTVQEVSTMAQDRKQQEITELLDTK